MSRRTSSSAVEPRALFDSSMTQGGGGGVFTIEEGDGFGAGSAGRGGAGRGWSWAGVRENAFRRGFVFEGGRRGASRVGRCINLEFW
jgi:hypothetical protein